MVHKVLLVTIQNNTNFGNRLQNYALQTVLEKTGVEVFNLSLNNVPLASLNISAKEAIKTIIKKAAIKLGIKKYLRSVSLFGRKKKCISFSKRFIHNYMFFNRNELNAYSFDDFDVAVTGSDQVWHNWKRIKDELSFYYLEFIDSKKRVSYAPSFGFSDFSVDDIEKHRKGLLGMRSLSCREQDGSELIYRLTGRVSKTVMDPTLLLSADEWKEIEERPRFHLPEKYILQFMLGDVSSEYKEEINRIAERKSAQVININSVSNPEFYSISPSEFVWLIRNANTICTDSFHATVFSIIFEKDLRVFERISPRLGDMFGRIDNLLQPLSLGELIYQADAEMPLSTHLDEKARSYYMNQKEQSIQYLYENIGL